MIQNNIWYILGSGNCLGIKENTFSWLDCFSLHPYICQTQQTANTEKIRNIPQPTLVLPLDNTPKENQTNFWINFYKQKIPHNRLSSSAYFLGANGSFIDVKIDQEINLISGTTISMWIKANKIADGDTVLADFRKTNTTNILTIFITSKYLKIKMCKISCITQQTLLEIPEEIWTFLAITIKSFEGKVYINEISKAIQFSDTDKPIWESKNFLTIGSEKTGGKIGQNNFHGKMSCFQIFPKYLSSAQIHHIMKTCYLEKDYPQSELCPIGFFPLKDSCYQISTNPTNYSMAELTCLNQTLPLKLAFPHNFQLQEILFMYAQQSNISDLWIGLDSMSGKFILIIIILFYLVKKIFSS